MVFCCPVAGSIWDGDQWNGKDNGRREDVLAMLNFILEMSDGAEVVHASGKNKVWDYTVLISHTVTRDIRTRQPQPQPTNVKTVSLYT
jgi:hypothetical protein